MKVNRLGSLCLISICEHLGVIRVAGVGWRNRPKTMHPEMTAACIQPALREITRENTGVR